MTHSGNLTDFEGTTVRIDDKPYPATAHVMKVCSVVLGKKARVCYQITDGKISKIWQEDEQKSYGGQPVQGNKKDCTSNPTPFETSTPNTPALKTVEGQIVEIAPEAHKITVKDRTGALHTMVWAPPMHDQMSCRASAGEMQQITHNITSNPSFLSSSATLIYYYL
jgi:hypothetical protein